MRIGFSLLAFICLLGASTTMHAQRAMYVDMTQIMESIDEYEQAQKQLDQQAEKWRKEIERGYGDIEQMYNDFQAQQVLLSDEERRRKEEEIIGREQAIRKKNQKYFGAEGDLFKKRQELVKPIQERVYKVISDYAEARGFAFVLDRSNSALIYANPEQDKTQDIIKALK